MAKVRIEQTRGQLTSRIKKRSSELLGYEICVRELRLMPYLQYCLVNSERITPNKVNSEEREILHKWRTSGFLEGGASQGGPKVTKQFWDIITEIIYLGYVDLFSSEIELTSNS